MTEPARMRDRSLIAGVNAMFRSVESRRPERERILFDPFAARFAERDLRVALVRAARFVVPHLHRLVRELQTAHCVRHAAIDVLLERALAAGVTQVVIVGAGYDMRAHRFGGRWPGVRWFEVDHPATQARKVARLPAPGPGLPVVARVAADLLRHDLAPLLAGVGFDPLLSTCFVMEGLLHYLTQARLRSLLFDMASEHAQRSVLASFIRTDMYERAPPLFVRAVQALREVPHLHFLPSALAALGSASGFARCTTLTNAEQLAAFAPIARGRAPTISQDLAIFSNSNAS